jgi:hypothetical protein
MQLLSRADSCRASAMSDHFTQQGPVLYVLAFAIDTMLLATGSFRYSGWTRGVLAYMQAVATVHGRLQRRHLWDPRHGSLRGMRSDSNRGRTSSEDGYTNTSISHYAEHMPHRR